MPRPQDPWSGCAPATGARSLRLLAGEGPTSRADLARGTGLSRTTVSSLVADLIDSGQVVETTDRGRPHKGGSGRPPLLVALAHPPAAWPASTSATARAGGDRRPQRQVLDEEHGGARRRRARGERSTRRRGWSATACVGRPGASDLHAVGMCVPAPIDRRSARISAGILPGWRDLVPRRGAARRSACRSSSTTTPTSARSPSSTTERPAGTPTSSTSRSPAGWAPASCSAADCTAAPPASPARSATSRSARTARSAAAATGAAWRPRSRPADCWRCCSRRTTRSSTLERRARARRRG